MYTMKKLLQSMLFYIFYSKEVDIRMCSRKMFPGKVDAQLLENFSNNIIYSKKNGPMYASFEINNIAEV